MDPKEAFDAAITAFFGPEVPPTPCPKCGRPRNAGEGGDWCPVCDICDICKKEEALFQDEETGLSYCETCRMTEAMEEKSKEGE